MYHFIQLNRTTGEVAGYLSSSTRELLPKPISEEHEHVEVTDAEHLRLVRAAIALSRRALRTPPAWA